ncbi:hypothetical protein ACN4EK_12365 [Pantanalinema rosaneae CENA516]|uniref:hypothetical protein n=1 Tax=Pantanalinema rosaneae TaxID=1620701 RepID=UPI003D6F7932
MPCIQPVSPDRGQEAEKILPKPSGCLVRRLEGSDGRCTLIYHSDSFFWVGVSFLEWNLMQ